VLLPNPGPIGYPQNLVMVAVEIAGMEQGGFPTVESSRGQFAPADPIDIDYVPLFFHRYPSSLIAGLTQVPSRKISVPRIVVVLAPFSRAPSSGMAATSAILKRYARGEPGAKAAGFIVNVSEYSAALVLSDGTPAAQLRLRPMSSASPRRSPPTTKA
jgi:hypothetical protein